MSKTTKIIVFVVILIVAGIAAYFILSKPATSPVAGSSTTPGSAANVQSAKTDLAALLNSTLGNKWRWSNK